MNIFIRIVVFILFIPVAVHFSYLFDAAVFQFHKPATVSVQIKKPAKTTENILLVPLDSRPPCLEFVKGLGKINNIDIITPPKEFLDNYHTPADAKKIAEWLNTNIPYAENAIVSTDMLRYGGLIASRTGQVMITDDDFFDYLDRLKKQTNYYIFSIIPRLIIPDDPETRPWPWHVTVYATKKDIYDHFGHTYDFEDMDGMLKRIPPEIIENFNQRFNKNNTFNMKLFEFAQKHDLSLIFGQDDAHPFGRPYENKLNIEQIIKSEKSERIVTSNGADELAMMELASHVVKKQKKPVKIFIEYSTQAAPDMVFHFMAEDIHDTVLDKINAIGAETASSKDDSDFILFVHAGDQRTSSDQLKNIANKIIALSKEKPLALVDLSANFMQRETILKTLINENFPLSSLIAYAGWNTAGNSIGTALSQACIFTVSKKSFSADDMPYIYKTNFEFTISRILDDWVYQKDVQDITDPMLIWRNVNIYQLGTNKASVEDKVADSIKRRQNSFFYKNFARYPFYSDEHGDYYITELNTEIKLPWDRTFEIDLKINTQTGIVIKNN